MLKSEIKYFTKKELACPCCGLFNINEFSLKKIDLLRELLGTPLFINSACRCRKHNVDIGGKEFSSHLCSSSQESFAFDVACKDAHERFLIIRAAIRVGFHRIGVYEDFIHLDDDLKKRSSIWYGLLKKKEE